MVYDSVLSLNLLCWRHWLTYLSEIHWHDSLQMSICITQLSTALMRHKFYSFRWPGSLLYIKKGWPLLLWLNNLVGQAVLTHAYQNNYLINTSCCCDVQNRAFLGCSQSIWYSYVHVGYAMILVTIVHCCLTVCYKMCHLLSQLNHVIHTQLVYSEEKPFQTSFRFKSDILKNSKQLCLSWQ